MSEAIDKHETVRQTSTCSTARQASEMASPKPPRSSSPTGSTCSNASSVFQFAMGNTKGEGPTRVVLLAVDPTENSKRAFDWYVENMWGRDDCLILLYVAKPPAIPMTNNNQKHFDQYQANLAKVEEKTTEVLKIFEDACNSKEIMYKVNREKSDEPGKAIISVADKVNADVIIMGTRGLGAIGKIVKSAVSDYVMKNTNKPLIVIPGTKMRKAEEKRQSTTSLNSTTSSNSSKF